ncbi:MAG: glycosyltransferase family 2 protein [bacterium]
MISAIIINYNGKRFVDKLADSLNSQSSPYDEVVIVDNNSTDGSGELLFKELRNCVLLKMSVNKGFASAVNLAVNQCSGENIMLLNNDLYIDVCFIERALKNIDENDKTFFAPLVMDYSGERIDSAGDEISAGFRPVKRFSGQKRENIKREMVKGFSMSAAYFRKKDFISLCGLDEKFFMYFEDVDFSIRASQRGYTILFTPECVAYHYVSAGTKSIGKGLYSPQKTYWEARNRVWAFFKSSYAKNPLKVMEFIFGTASSMRFHAVKSKYILEYMEGLIASLNPGRRK